MLQKLVRGLNPWPVALTTLEGKRIKIIKTKKSDKKGKPGYVVSVNPLTVACADGAVEILTLQPEGKKPMDSKSFLMGHRLDTNSFFV